MTEKQQQIATEYLIARLSLAQACFLSDPSAKNYRSVTLAMLAYQAHRTTPPGLINAMSDADGSGRL